MGESRAESKREFGRIDLDLLDFRLPSGASESDAPDETRHSSVSFVAPAFGQLDVDLGGIDFEPPGEPTAVAPLPLGPMRAPMVSEVVPSGTSSRGLSQDETPTLDGDALGLSLDGLLQSFESPAPSQAPASGISPLALRGNANAEDERGERTSQVARLRELYVEGEVDEALALAATIASGVYDPVDVGPVENLVPAYELDHPDSSVAVEVESVSDLSYRALGLVDLVDNVDPANPFDPPSSLPPLSLTQRHAIPRVLISTEEIAALPIDHRAGFLLAHVDGMQTVAELLDVCPMPITEALRHLGTLERLGVVVLD